MSVKVTAKMVKELRTITGAGMMDCKKALVETNGDIQAAIDFLRKKGQKLSAKRADREAKEGVVVAITNDDNTKGIAINLSCETDFVAKNEDFIDFAKSIADLALSAYPETKEALLELDYEGMPLKDKIVEQIGVIGEKLEVSKYETLEGDLVVPYIHMGYKLGVLLGLSKSGDAALAAGKNVAMQIAAMNPVAVDKADVAPEVVEREKAVAVGKMKDDPKFANKPAQVLEKIAAGMLGKFFKENTLMNQAYVKDNKSTVKDYLNSVEKGLVATAFKRVTLG